MTVIKLEPEAFLVYAPVAPTPDHPLGKELIADARRGEVHPADNGFRHQETNLCWPFARCFPQAQVFVAPQQWSFPVNLPLSWLGLPAKRTSVLPFDSSNTPLADQFDWAIAPRPRFGQICRSCLISQAIAHADVNRFHSFDSRNPPAIAQLTRTRCCFTPKKAPRTLVADTQENRRKGWQRIALFAMYFSPSVLEVPPWSQVLANAPKRQNALGKLISGCIRSIGKQIGSRSFEALREEGGCLWRRFCRH